MTIKKPILLFFIHVCLLADVHGMEQAKEIHQDVQPSVNAQVTAAAPAGHDTNFNKMISSGDAYILNVRCIALYYAIFIAEKLMSDTNNSQIVLNFANDNAVKALNRVVEFYYERKASINDFMNIESSRAHFTIDGVKTNIKDLASRVCKLFSTLEQKNLEYSISRMYQDIDRRQKALGEDQKKALDKIEYSADLIRARRIDDASSVISQGNIDLNLCDSYGYPLIFHACFYGDKKIVDAMLKQGVNINQRNEIKRLIPIMIAPSIQTIEYLKLKGANLDDKDERGYDVLEHAARNNDLETIERIAQLKAIIRFGDKILLKPALFLAIDMIDLRLFAALAGAGANPEDMFDGKTVYQYAKKRLTNAKDESSTQILGVLHKAEKMRAADSANAQAAQAHQAKKEKKELDRAQRLKEQDAALAAREKKKRKALLLAQKLEKKEKELAKIERERINRLKEEQAREKAQKNEEVQRQKLKVELEKQKAEEKAKEEESEKARIAKEKSDKDKRARETEKRNKKKERRAQERTEKAESEKMHLLNVQLIEKQKDEKRNAIAQRLASVAIDEALIALKKEEQIDAIEVERLKRAQTAHRQLMKWKAFQFWRRALHDKELNQWTMQKAQFAFDMHEKPKIDEFMTPLIDSQRKKTVLESDYFAWLNAHLDSQIRLACFTYLSNKPIYKPAQPTMCVNCKLCEQHINKDLLKSAVKDKHWSDFERSKKYQALSYRIKIEALKSQRKFIERTSSNSTTLKVAGSENKNGTTA